MSLIERLTSYLSEGALYQAGYDHVVQPKGTQGIVANPGASYFRWGNQYGIREAGGLLKSPPQPVNPSIIQALSDDKTLVQGVTEVAGKRAIFGALVPPVLSAYFAYRGYKGDFGYEPGMSGLLHQVGLDLAITSSMAKWGVQRSLVEVNGVSHQLTRTVGGLGRLRIGLGAGIGGIVGQGILGTPGAFMGAFVGGGLVKNGPMAAVSAAVIGGSYMVGRGTYDILKAGYNRSQAKRRIDTAGDTASFFTQNAMTMRERAVQAMSNSRLNARSALGMEASYMNFNRNYFSPYRRF